MKLTPILKKDLRPLSKRFGLHAFTQTIKSLTASVYLEAVLIFVTITLEIFFVTPAYPTQVSLSLHIITLQVRHYHLIKTLR